MIQPIRPSVVSGATIKREGLEAASQSWGVGAPLVNSSGKLAQAASKAALTAGLLVGLSTHPASGVTSAACGYVAANPIMEFEVCVDDAQASNNAPGTGTVALALLNGKYGLQKDAASGNWYLDVSTSGIHAMVTALVDEVGTVQGRVRVQLLNSACAYNAS